MGGISVVHSGPEGCGFMSGFYNARCVFPLPQSTDVCSRHLLLCHNVKKAR